ncbi:hypothetical protein [Flavobacterium reichenbachii]|uniref:Uncharacterized protein n=1 Tax=Flavobacterium reichenbachii TaxID=362418 RepID=A0A085ZPF3_9FLAO|nr:hypothetical protein [Flavobacterium reichenbachii]KFF06317.1 hypothetical protein IW19_12610 [Flavobacterium reichenbachii]OXB17469.1 hypothetical protein B0A68_04005 [Flavobacterium reichenbachii]
MIKRNEFIQHEIWMLSTFGAFQRANIYKDGVTETERKQFRTKLRGYIENSLITKYLDEVTEENHIQNIIALSEYTTEFSSILKQGRINIGISQKLLNLYLKYLWCLDKISAPPHFPVDSIIQKHLKIVNPTPWTKMTNVEEYLRVIQVAKDLLPSKPYSSIAELELYLFERN